MKKCDMLLIFSKYRLCVFFRTLCEEKCLIHYSQTEVLLLQHDKLLVQIHLYNIITIAVNFIHTTQLLMFKKCDFEHLQNEVYRNDPKFY